MTHVNIHLYIMALERFTKLLSKHNLNDQSRSQIYFTFNDEHEIIVLHDYY